MSEKAQILFVGNDYLQLMYAEYQRDCIKLVEYLQQTTQVIYTYERIVEVVQQIGCESTHPMHLIPSHIRRLILNKQHLEYVPKPLQAQVSIEFPTECEQGCLKKFYALLEAGKEAA